MFDLDEMIAACQAAVSEPEPLPAIRAVLDRVLARPGEPADVLGGGEGGITILHRADDLTVLNVIWAPGMRLYPHDHQMWAAIGIYGGQEDNTFFRRAGESLVGSGGKVLQTSDVALLGRETIHAVENPTRRFTGAIHVYGGDFVEQPRSQWDFESLTERPYDFDETLRQFADANAAARADGLSPGAR